MAELDPELVSLSRQDPLLDRLIRCTPDPTEYTLRIPYQSAGWESIEIALKAMGLGHEIPHAGWFSGQHTLARLVKWRAGTLRIYADWLSARPSTVILKLPHSFPLNKIEPAR